MKEKPTYEEMEQRVRELEEESLMLKRAEEAYQYAEKMYRAIFECTGTATIVSNEAMTILMVNSEFEKLSGYSKKEIEGKKSWTEFVVVDDLEKIKGYHRLRRIDPFSAPRNHEFVFVDREGNLRHVYATVAIISGTTSGVASFLDITEYKEAEKERQKAKKLEGVLEMAGAVCHEMNQPMQTIMGNCELLLQEMDKNNPSYIKVMDIRSQIERMGTLTGKLMNIKGYKTMKYLEGHIIDIDKASR
jgi:PAS domain S-box-containing protein